MPKWYENPEGKSEIGEYRDALPDGTPGQSLQGRGAAMNPGNRFETVRLHVLGEYLDQKAAEAAENPEIAEAFGDSGEPKIPTQVFHDNTQRIINKVEHPEMVGFDWTLNPYRGCEHGCLYCQISPRKTPFLALGWRFLLPPFAVLNARR